MDSIILSSYFFNYEKNPVFLKFKPHIRSIISTDMSLTDRFYEKLYSNPGVPEYLINSYNELQSKLKEHPKAVIFCFLSDRAYDFKYWLAIRKRKIVVFDYASENQVNALNKINYLLSDPFKILIRSKDAIFHRVMTSLKARLDLVISTSINSQYSNHPKAVVDDIPFNFEIKDSIPIQIGFIFSRYYFENDDLNAKHEKWEEREKFLQKLEKLIVEVEKEFELKLFFHPRTKQEKIPVKLLAFDYAFGVDTLDMKVAIGTSSTALSLLAENGVSILILAPNEIVRVRHLKRLMTGYSEALNAEVVDFKTALTSIRSLLRGESKTNKTVTSNTNFKNLETYLLEFSHHG